MNTSLERTAHPNAPGATRGAFRLALAGLLLFSLVTASAGEPPASRSAFAGWLRLYGQAWIHRDPDRLVVLFAKGARYYETPFDKPMIGRQSIYKYWSDGVESGQRDITFQAEVLDAKSGRGLAHWHARFIRVPSGKVVELDGILQARFDAAGQCTEFREWWHRSEEPGG